MRKEKKGGFVNLFSNNEPEMVDRFGNKINYVAPASVGNVSSLTMSTKTNDDNSTIDSTPYYNISPYKEILGKIAAKDMNQYRLLTCAKQRQDVDLISREFSSLNNNTDQGSRIINKERTSRIKVKLYDAKNRRIMCFNNSKRKLMEIKNNMDLNMSTTGGRKKTHRRNKKSKKTRKNKRNTKK
jgi:hypothetical protein